MRWSVAMDPVTASSTTWLSARASAIPRVILVDKEGRVVSTSARGEKLGELLGQLLGARGRLGPSREPTQDDGERAERESQGDEPDHQERVCAAHGLPLPSRYSRNPGVAVEAAGHGRAVRWPSRVGYAGHPSSARQRLTAVRLSVDYGACLRHT